MEGVIPKPFLQILRVKTKLYSWNAQLPTSSRCLLYEYNDPMHDSES